MRTRTPTFATKRPPISRHHYCSSGCVDMFRLPTLLILMALTGGPDARFVCDAWCQSESDSNGVAGVLCHGVYHQSEQDIQSAADTCVGAAALSPFVTEPTYKAVATGCELAVATAVSASLRDLRHDDGAFLLRGNAGLPLAISVTILRI
ncbi:MAG: hypothetical protein HY824_09155 [Acidobacteria bacterium]|nr:hypothetical protein [Acidobacteriota bacterium]